MPIEMSAGGAGDEQRSEEAVNNKIKPMIRMVYGFRNIDILIAFVILRW